MSAHSMIGHLNTLNTKDSIFLRTAFFNRAGSFFNHIICPQVKGAPVYRRMVEAFSCGVLERRSGQEKGTSHPTGARSVSDRFRMAMPHHCEASSGALLY
jgi:hypothetical protein